MTADATAVTGWYVTRESGDMDGPLTDADMREAISRGRVKPEDRVWRDGMDEWVEARRIPNYGELRKAYVDAAAAAGREKSRDRVRAQKPWGGNSWEAAPTRSERRQDEQTRAPTASSNRAPVPAPSYPQPTSSSGGERSGKSFNLEDLFKSLSKGGQGNADYDKAIKDVTQKFKKLGTVPQGAIIFFVLGLVFTPMLPVFWFIAWRIWAKANGK